MAGGSSSTANIAKGLTQRGSKNNVIDAKHAERTLSYYINYIKFFEETDFKRHHDEPPAHLIIEKKTRTEPFGLVVALEKKSQTPYADYLDCVRAAFTIAVMVSG